MEPKTDPGAMSEKGHQKVTKMTSKMDHFGSHFPLKIDERIDAKIDAEQVMNIREKSMPKMTPTFVENPSKI